MEIIETEWFGVPIMRPNNLLTNQVVGIAGAILSYLIWKKNVWKDPYLTSWQWFFLLVGLGGALGGIAHGFNYDFPETRHTFIHKLAWTVGGIGLFMGERACISFLPSKGVRKVLMGVVTVKLVFYLCYLYYSQIFQKGNFNHFDIVRYNTAFALLGIILTTHIYSLIRDNNSGSWYVIGGILSLIPVIFIYNYKISLHQWFDFNDISHFIEIICIVCIYLGVVKGYPGIHSSLSNRSDVPESV